MKKIEMNIMMSHYGELLEMNEAGFDKESSIFDMKRLFTALNLENEMKIVENEHFIRHNNLKFMQKEGYSTLLDIVMKYNGSEVVEYENLVSIAEELMYDFSEEHQKCVKTCLNMIENI